MTSWSPEVFSLDGKVALVLGGRGLLGRRLAAGLHAAGAVAYAADLPMTSKAALNDPGFVQHAGVRQLEVDVTQEVSLDEVVATVLEAAGRIDVLVYSVTRKTDDSYSPFTEARLEGWRDVMRAELDGLFLATQRVGSVMENQGGGAMVFVSSIYGVVGNDQRIYEGANLAELYGKGQRAGDRIFAPAVYAAAKGGVISLTRFLAAYWGEAGIRVNCISPGGAAHPGENESFLRRYCARVPLGRKSDMDEVVGPVVFLASDAASYITGHNLLVDGGWTAW